MMELDNAHGERIAAAKVLLHLRGICRDGRSEDCERGQCPCLKRAGLIVLEVVNAANGKDRRP